MKVLNNLVGQELSFIELDNIMQNNSFYSVFDDGVTENIKHDKSIYYLSTIDNESAIIIYFDITVDNEEGEAEENFDLIITGIEVA